MNSILAVRRIYILFILSAIVFTACTKIESTTLGGGLIPPIDGVNTRDTFLTVNTDLFPDRDTFVVHPSDDHVLGHISNDPLFGRTDAAINVQLYPQFFPYYFALEGKDSLFLDSVVLSLAYRGVWGDTNSTLNLKVYEIANSVPFTDTLYNNTKQLTYTSLLGQRNNIDPKKLDDSIWMQKDSGRNMLRIRLDNSFGQRLLKTYDSTNAYKNDTTWRSHFNGFGIVADPVGNALLRIGLTDANTRLSVYYRVKRRDQKLDTVVRHFTHTSRSSSSNYIKRDRTGAEISQYLGNTTVNDSLLYLQSDPGTYASIRIPGLTGFPNVIVHRAELQVQQVPHNTNLDNLFTPPALFLAAYSEDSLARFLVPKAMEYSASGISNLASFGSYPLSRTNSSGQAIYAYNFDITRYVQELVTTKGKNYSLALYAPYSEALRIAEKTTFRVPLTTSAFNLPALGRVRIAGGSHTRQPMRLRIVYSVL